MPNTPFEPKEEEELASIKLSVISVTKGQSNSKAQQIA